jgi:hypothetical protein
LRYNARHDIIRLKNNEGGKRIMQTVFNKAKVKSWIKKAHKHHSFGYGHGYITDGHVLLVEEQHMQPTILELYGTLNPECRYPAETLQKMMDLPKEHVEAIDSELEYVPDSKTRLRIFYDPKTGKEFTIDCKYFDLLDDPKTLNFYSDDLMSRLWIVYNDTVVGLIAPVRLQDKLSHIKFKVEEAEQV